MIFNSLPSLEILYPVNTSAAVLLWLPGAHLYQRFIRLVRIDQQEKVSLVAVIGRILILLKLDPLQVALLADFAFLNVFRCSLKIVRRTPLRI